MRLSIAVAVLIAAFNLAADETFQCGTTEENDQHVRAMTEVARMRAERMSSKGEPQANAVLRDNLFLLAADDTNTPYRRPLDLSRKSLHFTPAGEESYQVRVAAMEWIGDSGKPLPGNGTRIWRLAKPFNIFGRSATQLYVTDVGSVHLDTPKLPGARQYGDFELAAFQQAVIAPLLLAEPVSSNLPLQVQVRETATDLLVTWHLQGAYAVQALISADGSFRFTYDQVARVDTAGVLLTSGDESWRGDRRPLFEVSDAANDATGVADDLRRMLDIESVAASRLSDADIVEFRITLAEAPDYQRVGRSSWIGYNIVLGEDANKNAAVRAVLYGNGPEFRLAVPVFGGASANPAVTLDGRTLIIRLPDHVLDVTSVVTIASRLEAKDAADVVSAQRLALPSPARRLHADLSAADGATLRLPILEAFTLPVLNPARVWDQVRWTHTLGEADVDAVAIYQTFPTDLILYAGAYATYANAGASGIRSGDAHALTTPKKPTLLHMNRLSLPGNDRSASHVLLHEFGHRWLFHFQLAENGTTRYVLNPLRAHPAQWVHTRAAFNVHAGDDASAMGGSSFTDNGDGSFTSGSGAHFGYSWLDLYLMGLASPNEVQPFFYIANSNPVLGDAYYAPRQLTVRGERRNVHVQQVIDGTGPRLPAYPNAQTRFKVAFVLLSDREPTAAEIERTRALRGILERDFRTATGGRGEISTAFAAAPPASGPRRRVVRK